MFPFYILILAFLPLISVTTAHKEPKTPQDIEVQRALQAAAYHVRFIPIERIINRAHGHYDTVCSSSS